MRTKRSVFRFVAAVAVGLVALVAAPGAGAARASAAAPSSQIAPASLIAVSPQGAPVAPDPADAELRTAVQGLVDAGATGALAVVNDGTRQVRATAGLARLSPARPVSVGDQTRVGSITKTFMSTLTLQLVGQGRLRLDDPIERWLPGTVPNGAAITVRMLLSHTSGLFNFTDDPDFVPEVIGDPTRVWTPQQLLAVAFAHDPVFAPGSSWSYSNTNYIVIGLLLQKVTGERVENLVARRIAGPLRLRDTYLATSPAFRGPHLDGYLPPELTGDDTYLDTSGWSPSWAWSAGAMVSTAGDLADFYRALLGGRLVSPPLLDQMLTTRDVGNGVAYGLGLFSLETPCGTVWGHDGSVPGYLSFSFTDRSARRSGVLLIPTSLDTRSTQALQQALPVVVCRMFGQPVSRTVTGSLAAVDWVTPLLRVGLGDAKGFRDVRTAPSPTRPIATP